MNSASHGAPSGPRQALRTRLLAQREQFVAGDGFEAAFAALARHLTQVLSELEPQSLGLYWPHRSEFNAVGALLADAGFAKLPLALPFAQRAPVQMHYRAWDRQPPAAVDECGIATSAGAPVVPDVALVPCVGFTAAGYRLGYGGGYFDRWLAEHPHVTAVGVAWAIAEVDAASFAPAPHDQPLTLIVTERGVV
ncbi:MAG TPA: 5-formyltetrahydrofolate cyclo-ligase [Burkholderiaceae bacterium]|nr:5-formyltetrahydrofolate cyclo-ligase [Burkholderiaceae bacterium]